MRWWVWWGGGWGGGCYLVTDQHINNDCKFLNVVTQNCLVFLMTKYCANKLSQLHLFFHNWFIFVDNITFFM